MTRPTLVRSVTHVFVTGPDGGIYSLPADGLTWVTGGGPLDLIGPLVCWGVACCPEHFAPIGSYRISLN